MKTNTSKDFSTEDLKRLLNKLYKQFNKLSESTMNPLLTGMFLLGVACTFFPVSTVGYLAMVFGASSGLAYAVAKKQTNLQLPTWGFSAIGVATALVYAFAGIPGVILTAGLSGGWYVHSHYSDKIQEWKTDFRQFAEDFKTNPFNQTFRVTYFILQHLADFILKIEPAPKQLEASTEDKPETEEPEEVIEQQNSIDNSAGQNPDEIKLNTTIEQTSKKLEQEPAVFIPNIDAQDTPKEPLPVLFSEQAQQTTAVAPVTTQPKTKPTTPKAVKPKKDTVLAVMGQPIIQLERKQVQIDNSWLGLGKAFIYSLDPRVDLMNGQEKIEQGANNNRRRI